MKVRRTWERPEGLRQEGLNGRDPEGLKGTRDALRLAVWHLWIHLTGKGYEDALANDMKREDVTKRGALGSGKSCMS